MPRRCARASKKFGGKIVADNPFDAHGGDLRDTAITEFIQATRGRDHDVVAVADEADEFGPQLVYNTDSPRPVVGTAGLTPAAWGRPVEAWAAVQLQNRFKKLAARTMRPTDYASWMGRARRRRGSGAAEERRPRRDPRPCRLAELRGRWLQGPCAELPRLGTASCASRSSISGPAPSSPWPRSRASCTRAQTSTRSASTGPRAPARR